MKTVLSFFILFSLTTSLISQNDNMKELLDYKNFITYYDKASNYMETGDLNNGRKFIRNAMNVARRLIKKGYESGIQSELANLEKWQAGFDAKKQKAVQMRSYESELGQWHGNFDLLKKATPFSECGYLWEKMKAFDRAKVLAMIKEFKASETFASTSQYTQQRTQELENDIEGIEQVLAAAKFTEKADKKIADLQRTHVESFFDDDVDDLGYYINSFARVAPTNTTLKAYQKKYTELTSNKDKVLSNALARKQKAAVVSELPEADVHDAGMERDFMQVAAASSPGYKPTSAIITSRYWSVNNDVAGRPISRQRIAAITYKDASGTCYVEHILFMQDYSGSAYRPTKIYSAYGKKAFDCKLQQ